MAIESGTKFLGIASSVNTTERRSKQINDKQEYHTIEDIVAAAAEGITLPDADEIVSQLSAENYTDIESNLQGKLPYEQTIIRIDKFSTATTSPNIAWNVVYSNKTGGVAPVVGAPFVVFDAIDLTWYIDTNATFSADYRYTCNVYQYTGGQTNPPGLVTAEFDSEDPSRIFIFLYDQSFQPMSAQTTDIHLQFGLEINIYNF